MFGIDSLELMVIALVALLVIGPKDLPKAMRWVGQWVGKGRAMSRHLRTGFDAMMREAELEEMQKLWAQQNEAIMKATQLPENALPDLSGPVPDSAVPDLHGYAPWPEPETPVETALAEPPPRRARKPRAKKPAAQEAEQPADPGEAA